jgi:TetR/AcrR family transcriptional repressor of mexCD-oprJ operon
MASDLPRPVPEPVPLPARQALQERVADAILDAAARTFATRGASANLADVAAAAGVARATVYRYFSNRTRLIGELARVAAERAHERLAAARIDEVPVEEGVSRAVRAFVELGDAFVVLVRQRGRPDEDEFEQLVAAPLRKLLERGRSEGQIRDDIPTAWLAESLIGGTVGALRHGSLGRDDTVTAITNVFLRGAIVPASGTT